MIFLAGPSLRRADGFIFKWSDAEETYKIGISGRTQNEDFMKEVLLKSLRLQR